MHSNCPPWLEKILKFPTLIWLKVYSDCPPWLEKILKFTALIWLKMHSNCPPWYEKIFKFTALIWLKIHSNCPPWLEKNLKFPPLIWHIFQVFHEILRFSRNFQKYASFSRSSRLHSQIPVFSRFFQVFPGSGHPVFL